MANVSRVGKKSKAKKGGKKTKRVGKKAGRKGQSRAQKANINKLKKYNRFLAQGLGKREAHAKAFGKAKKSASKKSKAKKAGKTSRRAGSHKSFGRCHLGACAGRPIMGGAKGMATHKRNHHGR